MHRNLGEDIQWPKQYERAKIKKNSHEFTNYIFSKKIICEFVAEKIAK